MTSEHDGRDKKSGRFLKGTSPNPKGRPRRPRTVGAAISSAFNEKVQVNEHGRRRKITKLEAAAKQIANQSASGDPRSVKLGMELAQKAEERQSRASAGPTQLSETDSQIAARLVPRLRQTILEENDGHEPNPADTK